MMKSIMKLVVLLSILIACSPATPLATVTPTLAPFRTSVPSETSIPSETPTLTSTIAPTFTITLTSTSLIPLTAHDWKPAPILVSYNNVGNNLCSVCFLSSPKFMLYANGDLFLYASNEVNGDIHFRYLYKKLDRSQVCQFLNTIDQTGFFDFDPATYSIPGLSDGADWRVEVYAWRNKDVNLYALGDLADLLNSDSGRNPSEVINPSSVRDTFALLHNYPLDGLEVYIPKLLGLWIWKSSSEFANTKDWTVDNISLAKLYKKAGSVVDILPRPIYLDGKDAENIYEMFDNFNYYGEVTQNGVGYGIYVRPVFPFEKISDDGSVMVPDVNQMRLPLSLHCSPSDGTMPIPPYKTK